MKDMGNIYGQSVGPALDLGLGFGLTHSIIDFQDTGQIRNTQFLKCIILCFGVFL